MALIDKYQVVPLKGIDGDRFLAHLIFELVNVDDLDLLAGKKRRAILIEQFGFQA
ncbi:MAG: hypothetical protein RQ723_05255 [Desulfuromonadales bacterium]|nr:hypothetical protein [Desulfuromonadales bacterium]